MDIHGLMRPLHYAPEDGLISWISRFRLHLAQQSDGAVERYMPNRRCPDTDLLCDFVPGDSRQRIRRAGRWWRHIPRLDGRQFLSVMRHSG